MQVNHALQWRYAVNTFSSQRVAETEIASLIDAVRLSPSAYGLQPYRLLVISDASLKSELVDYAYGQTQVRDCSHLFVFVAQCADVDVLIENYQQWAWQQANLSADTLTDYLATMRADLGGRRADDVLNWAHQQAYLALGVLLTAAATKQIDACPMAGFDPQAFDRVLGLTEQQLTTSVICPIGYRDQQDSRLHTPKIRVPYADFSWSY